MLSQKMTKEALLGLLGEDQLLALQQTRQQFDSNLQVLMQRETLISSAADEKVLAQLKLVEQVWKDFNAKMGLIRTDMSLGTLAVVSASSIQLMEECNLVVSLLEQASQQSITGLRWGVTGFLLLTALAAIYSYYLLRRYWVDRLQKIAMLTLHALKRLQEKIPQQV
jgi:hypothetical protein